MASLPKTVYVPPHLRKLASASKPKAILGLKATVVDESSKVSEKSKTQPLTHLGSSPLTTHNHSVKSLPKSPDSPPTTVQESEMPNNGKQIALDEPKFDPPERTHKAKNQKWPRDSNTATRKKNVWPKSRDMRYIAADSDSDGGVSFKSHSNGDPDYDVKKLLDWNGEWLPPPEQWSARKGFSNRHFGRDIEQWIDNQPNECRENMPLGLDAYRGREISFDGELKHLLVNGICKELVPRYWMSVMVEGKSMRQFWTEMPDRSPDTLSDIDFAADQPWWNRYEDSPSCFITGLVVPEAKVDSQDTTNHINPSGFASAEERIQEMMQRTLQKRRRMIAKRNRPLPEYQPFMPQIDDRRIRPAANVYFRPVQPADVRGITEIYNHYVENTIFANEFDARTERQIRDRVSDITRQGLPYIVAVAKGNPTLKPQGYVSEKIVGYVNLDDYCDQSSMYRFTFEMELFVHPGFTHKGIAKCLLDQILDMANTSYIARGGYEYINEYDYLKNGPARVIKTILLNVHHGHGEDIKWASDYLSPFRFVRAGHLSHVGYKKDQVVDISIFQHHTTEDIDPRGISTVPLERG